jgi:hypothetical protein
LVGITQTDGNGRYRIDNVAAGRYYVSAGLIAAPTFWPGATSKESAAAISVAAGAVFNVPDFSLAAESGGLLVKGRVIREGVAADQGPPPLTVRLTRLPARSGGPPNSYVGDVEADGSFELTNVTPGQYSIGFLPNVDFPYSPLAVARDVDNLEFMIPASDLRARLEGTVKIDGVAPLPPVGISLTPLDTATKARARTGWGFLEGKLSMPEVFAGHYAVEVTGVPEGYRIKSFTAGSENLLTENLTVTYINTPKLELTLSPIVPLPGVQVKGRLTNSQQVFLPANFRILSATSGLTIAGRVQEDGTFEFPLVPPGAYDFEFMVPFDATPAKRTIAVGNNTPALVEVPFLIDGRKRVVVKIVNTANNVQPGRDRLQSSLFPYLQAEGQPLASAVRARLAVDGTLEFLNVAPGTYRIFLASQRSATTIIPAGPGVRVVVGDKDVSVELSAR